MLMIVYIYMEQQSKGKQKVQSAFDFEAWRCLFNRYVDRYKLRLLELFRKVDANHDGELTAEELKKALRTSGE